MASPLTSVESTSITTRRMARRCRPPRCTATSTPRSTDSRARSARSTAGSAPEMSNSMQVTGRCASREIRSMFAPLAAIRPAMAAIAAGASGLPSTVTCRLPRPRAGSAGAGRDLGLQAQVGGQRGHLAVDRGQVGGAVAGQQHAEHQAPADHDLLDVEHAELVRGQDGEQAGGDARPVPAGHGDEQRHLRTGHGAVTLPTAAACAGRGSAGAARSGQQQVQVAELVPEVAAVDRRRRSSG